MSRGLPGCPNLLLCRGSLAFDKKTVGVLELSRSGQKPSLYIVDGTLPKLVEYQLGFFNEATTQALKVQDLLLRLQVPVEVQEPLRELGIRMGQEPQVFLCSYLSRAVASNVGDDQRWVAGAINFQGAAQIPQVYVNFFDYPARARSTFSLVATIVFYLAKGASYQSLLRQYPDQAEVLSTLYAASIEHRVGKLLVEAKFESFTYTHWERLSWASREGGEFFRNIHRTFQLLAPVLTSPLALEVFEIEGEFENLSANNPIVVNLR